MSRRAKTGIVALLLALACVTAAVATGAGQQVAIEGDPHRVTEPRLLNELRAAPVQVNFKSTDQIGGIPSVVGVAVSGHVELGFEFQIFPTSDEATVQGLGGLKEKDFDWPPDALLTELESRVRGVLANVAYAQYEVVQIEGHETKAEYLAADAAERRIVRALDDALFGSLPRDDPYAHALSPNPE